MLDMSKNWLLAILIITLSGCGSITVPVSGQLETGTTFTGRATANMNGEGTFEAVAVEGGLHCSGTYNAYDRSRTLTVPATCEDGRTATIVANRNKDLMGGRGTIVLSDGTTGTFIFGEGA